MGPKSKEYQNLSGPASGILTRLSNAMPHSPPASKPMAQAGGCRVAALECGAKVDRWQTACSPES